MKKIISFVILSLICSFSFAQTSPKTTSVVKESGFVANKIKGEFNFQMPEGTTALKIKETAKYYTEYFSVNYDANTRMAKITMVQDNSKGVIVRFLVSNEISTILYDGQEYEVDKFVGNFIQ